MDIVKAICAFSIPLKKKKEKKIRNETRIRLKTIWTIEKSTIGLRDTHTYMYIYIFKNDKFRRVFDQ